MKNLRQYKEQKQQSIRFHGNVKPRGQIPLIHLHEALGILPVRMTLIFTDFPTGSGS